MSTVIDGSLGITYPDSSNQPYAASPYTLKNRIINGSMVVDQRNAGASVTPANGAYTLDRWCAYEYPNASKFSVQQSSTAPTGFNSSLLVTSLSAYSIAAGDIYGIFQPIEGYNVADLGWGTANAKTITLSFWVRSSLTGTFGGALQNNAGDRAYPFSYTISAANTWEQKTITVSGDTTGTWLTTNGSGIQVTFGLGTGSNRSATAGAWAAGNYGSSTGATSVVAVNGATWYLTGVQLEIGTSATPFERRLYNQELANCQRYFISLNSSATVNAQYAVGVGSGTTSSYMMAFLPVTMRSSPTTTYSSMQTNIGGSGTNISSITSTAYPNNNCISFTAVGGSYSLGQQVQLQGTSTSAYLNFSAEL
jgi:hypothetical protein